MADDKYTELRAKLAKARTEAIEALARINERRVELHTECTTLAELKMMLEITAEQRDKAERDAMTAVALMHGLDITEGATLPITDTAARSELEEIVSLAICVNVAWMQAAFGLRYIDKITVTGPTAKIMKDVDADTRAAMIARATASLEAAGYTNVVITWEDVGYALVTGVASK